MAEAARLLGVTPNAIRQRVRRGTLPAAKGSAGTWYVFLADVERPADPADSWADDQTGDRVVTGHPEPSTDLVAALREEVRWLRSELERRSEADHRRDVLLRDALAQLAALPAGDDAAVAAQNRRGATEPGRPASDVLMLRWRRWWRRMTDG